MEQKNVIHGNVQQASFGDNSQAHFNHYARTDSESDLAEAVRDLVAAINQSSLAGKEGILSHVRTAADLGESGDRKGATDLLDRLRPRSVS